MVWFAGATPGKLLEIFSRNRDKCFNFEDFGHRERQTCWEPWLDTAPNLDPTFCAGCFLKNRQFQFQPSRVFLILGGLFGCLSSLSPRRGFLGRCPSAVRPVFPVLVFQLIGNGRNTVSRVLFRKRELSEFCGKLGEFCEKPGEFALAHK